MRTYSNFLLFEEVLDFAPQVDQKLYQFVQDVIRPRVRVVSTDCGTTVGTSIDVNYEIEGLIELATDDVLDKARITTLLTAGTYSVAVRNLYSCVAENGICSRCYQGTYIDMATPAVDSTIRLEPEYNYQTEVFIADGTHTDFVLTEPDTEYTKVLVLIDGVILSSGYTIANMTLSFTVAPANTKHIVVKYYKVTAQPFVGWLSNTYSGALLGMRPLSAQLLHIRPSLAQSLYNDEELNIMKQQLENYKFIPSDSMSYIENIHDKLERAIFISMLYGIFSNANA